MTDEVYLLLGTNLGDKLANLELAIKQLRNTVGKINKLSKIYETAAWGKVDQPSFYNQVICLKTSLAPADLLKKIHEIETAMGRIRFEKWGERLIDIDILFFGNKIIETQDLMIPHPEIQNRKFTLVPLLDVAPELMHPVLNKTMIKLLEECPDRLEVMPLSQVKL